MSSDESIGRRAFLAASTATILGLPPMAQAQQNAAASPTNAPPAASRKTLSEVIADFVTNFELKDAPPVVIEQRASHSLIRLASC